MSKLFTITFIISLIHITSFAASKINSELLINPSNTDINQDTIEVDTKNKIKHSTQYNILAERYLENNLLEKQPSGQSYFRHLT